MSSVQVDSSRIGFTTSDITEGTNLFYTTARANADFDTRLATKSTTNLTEGSNLYYTSARANADFDTRLATKSTTNLSEGTNLYYTTARANADFDTRLATKTTSNLTEGSNLYYTDARVRAAISGTSPINFSGGGVISLTTVPINLGGTNATDAPTARTNLDTRRNRNNYVQVKALADFPAPSGGIVTLADNTDYEISGTISFGTNTLVFGNNCAVFGVNKNTDVLSYTGTGTFITIANRSRMGFLGFSCPSGTLFSINGSTGSERIRLENLTITGVGTLGTITNMDHVEILTCNITNTVTTGFTVTGTTLSILKVVNCYMNNNAGTFLALGSSTLTGLGIEANVAKLASGQTFLSGSSPVISAGQVAGNAFLNSGGTIISGIGLNDANWFFFSNTGLDDTQYVGENFMQANATATDVTVAGTFVKIAGTTTAGQLANFTMPTNNKLQYTGTVTKNFLVLVRASFTVPTNNQTIEIQIFKNGVAQAKTLGEMIAATSAVQYNIATQGIIQLAQNDYIEIYATNALATNSDPTFVNFIVSIIAS